MGLLKNSRFDLNQIGCFFTFKLGFVGEGSFASAEATGTVAGSRDLLKKVDQNFKRQRHHAPINPNLTTFKSKKAGPKIGPA